MSTGDRERSTCSFFTFPRPTNLFFGSLAFSFLFFMEQKKEPQPSTSLVGGNSKGRREGGEERGLFCLGVSTLHICSLKEEEEG